MDIASCILTLTLVLYSYLDFADCSTSELGGLPANAVANIPIPYRFLRWYYKRPSAGLYLDILIDPNDQDKVIEIRLSEGKQQNIKIVPGMHLLYVNDENYRSPVWGPFEYFFTTDGKGKETAAFLKTPELTEIFEAQARKNGVTFAKKKKEQKAGLFGESSGSSGKPPRPRKRN